MNNQFIENIQVDAENRIVVNVKSDFHSFLQNDMVKSMLLDAAKNALKEDFIQLEISSKTFRVSVNPDTVENSKVIIEEEIAKNIEMALSFLNQFNK